MCGGRDAASEHDRILSGSSASSRNHLGGIARSRPGQRFSLDHRVLTRPDAPESEAAPRDGDRVGKRRTEIGPRAGEGANGANRWRRTAGEERLASRNRVASGTESMGLTRNMADVASNAGPSGTKLILATQRVISLNRRAFTADASMTSNIPIGATDEESTRRQHPRRTRTSRASRRRSERTSRARRSNSSPTACTPSRGGEWRHAER